jgi:acyl-CoA dehydrogenase-like protein
MDAAERTLLEDTVRDVVAGAAAAAEAEADSAAGVDTALTDVGWLEMLRAEPRDAVAIVFQALGSANAASSALDDVVVSALGIEPRADRAVLLPPFGSWDPPGTADGSHVSAGGIATARSARAGELLVVCRAGNGLSAVTVPAAAVETRPVRGIDPTAGLHLVRAERTTVDGAPSGADLDPLAWESAVALGRRAVAQQIAGACRAMLDLARTHALERVQFGRPIARFQAVRHRLAEALVAVEALEATLAAAGDEPGPVTAALAKSTAGRTADIVAAHCQQVLAGIGFTTEHPFHRYLKRNLAFEGVFGSADAITLDVGRTLLATRRVPTLIEL